MAIHDLKGQIARLPEQPGVYIFLGSSGETLYVGNDGGAYKQHVVGGQDFTNENWGDGINAGLRTLQPYDAKE